MSLGGLALLLAWLGAASAANPSAIQRLRHQAVSVLEELALEEKRVRKLEAQAQSAEKWASEAADLLKELQSEESAALVSLTAQMDVLAPRLRARYELGKRKNAVLLLSSSSMSELLWRWRTLGQVLRRDLALLEGAKAAFNELQHRRTRLEEAKTELWKRYREAEMARIEATRKKSELANLYQALWQESDLKEKAQKELVELQSSLSRYLDAIHANQKGAYFARKKGKLTFPVNGFIEVGFGQVLNPKFDTVTLHNGLDIRASKGSQVLSVGAGTVIHAGRFRGYGNLVIVDHGEGYFSLYAHLHSIKHGVGEVVMEKDVLGTVGDSDSLKGDFLYFELRQKGKPINPKYWLEAPKG